MGAAETWGNLGVMQYHSNAVSDACAAWEREIATLGNSGTEKARGRVYAWLAAGSMKLGDFKQALRSFDDAIVHGREAGDCGGVVSAWAGKCNLLLELGSLSEAQGELCNLETYISNSKTRMREAVLYARGRIGVETGLGVMEPEQWSTHNLCETKTVGCKASMNAIDPVSRADLELRSNWLFYAPDTAVASNMDIELPTDLRVWLHACAGGLDEVPKELLDDCIERLRGTCGIEELRIIDGLAAAVMSDRARGKRVAKSVVAELRSALDRTTSHSLRLKGHAIDCEDAIEVGDVVELVKVAFEASRTMRKMLGQHCGADMPGFFRRRDVSRITRCWLEACSKGGVALDAEDFNVNSVNAWDALLVKSGARLLERGQGSLKGAWERGAERVLAISSALNSERRLENLLELVVDSILDVTMAENCFVVLLDSQGKPSIEVGRGIAGTKGKDVKGAVSVTLLQQVLNEGRARLVVSALDDVELTSQPSIRLLSVQSIMACPLVHKQRVLGAIYVDNRSAAGSFDESDLRLLEVLSNHAAVAVQNSRLFEDLEGAYRSLAKAHEKVVRSAKLSIVGEVASGVAHDFNNLLTGILMRSQVLQADAKSDTDRQELHLIEKAALDAASMVKRVLAFSRAEPESGHERLSMKSLLRDVLEFTKPRWGGTSSSYRYEVRVLDDCEAEVTGNAGELREVFTNLVVNALDAMPNGGEAHNSVSCR